MDLHKSVLRTCAVVIIGAIALRFLGGPLLDLLQKPYMTSVILYLETGRYVRTDATMQIHNAQQSATVPTQEAGSVAVFAPSDDEYVQIRNTSGYPVDTEAMLQTPLNWDLTGDSPAVLILHTHATESYAPNGKYQESSSYRTLNENYNMLRIGEELTALLEKGGVKVIHDRTLHDHPSYNAAYGNARETIRQYLDQYPGIQLILDLHRDAVTGQDGAQVGPTTQTPNGTAAKVMVVVGTDAGGLNHPNWQGNMALGVKLHAQLEKAQPGICRPLGFRAQRYNQDMMEGAVLVEVGAAGNTLEQALVSCRYLADAVISLAHGSRCV